MTTIEKLAAINTAITAILNGAQEYFIGQQRVRLAELSTLLAERTRLEFQIANESGADVAVAYLGQR
jgi:hypothetical protein